MKLGMVGLGKMGANMTERLLNGGHEVVVFDRNDDKVERAEGKGAIGSRSLRDMAGKLDSPRVVWMMIPAGEPTQSVMDTLRPMLDQGDILVDGGNSNYKDSLRRAGELREEGIFFVDVGTSGGVWGLEQGYSMMVGGPGEAVDRIRPALKTLAPGPEKGWGHVGPSGSGHYVKMVHNGIEYGMMEAYAEGFDILKAKGEFDLDLHQVAEIWRFGSVIRSWLLDLTAKALEEDMNLSQIEGWVDDSGEGRWTVLDSIDLDVPAPVIYLSLMMRFVSRREESYAAKLLAAMRHQFGGHSVKTVEG